MKKYIFSVIMSFLFIFVISNNSYAALIRSVEIAEIEYPYLGYSVDTTAKIKRGSCTIKNIVWYKEGIKFFENEFKIEGNYSCRIYLNAQNGYELNTTTQVISNADESLFGQDNAGYFCELKYYVTKEKELYPKNISFSGMSKPSYNKSLDNNITSDNPEFYNYTKIEWYKDGELISYRNRAKEGEYICRVYIELYNDFELNSKVVASLGSKKAEKITKDHSGIYFEIVYIVSEGEDVNQVKEIRIKIEETPAFGKALSKVKVKTMSRSNYYEVGNVVWYCNGYRMLDEYFYDGEYKCRIYINFINGGYPMMGVNGYINDSTRENDLIQMGNQYYIEQTYNIKKYVISTLKFRELNIPEYGAVQDTKIESLEPGIYIPSMVYWYNDKGKYMSNMERFGEGTYTCKFSITPVIECDMKSSLKALINDENAKAYIQNNQITVEKTYEIKKTTIKWSKASEWAVPELKNAIDYALIPTSIDNKDFTQNITRAEFAAVAVRMYEALTMKTAVPIEVNPFTDTKDSDVLKAYNLGITNGTSATTFDPKSLITRQEMATMMVRALEKADVSTTVNLNKVKRFVDHDKIEDWALNGVYFMSDIGIIKGKGNNVFDVLGSATREEALAISIRSVNYYN